MVFPDWMAEEGLKVWNKAAKIEVAIICWSIWKHRNKLVWKAKIPVLDELVSLAKLNFVDWSNAQKMFVIPARVRELNGEGLEHWTDHTRISHAQSKLMLMGLHLLLETQIASRQGKLQPYIVEANKVAFSLAHASLFEAGCIFREDILPPDIASMVLDDLS